MNLSNNTLICACAYINNENFLTVIQCTGLKASWEKMETKTDFPVIAGTKVSLTCNAGHELTGSKTITCTTDTEFKFSAEPKCGK